MTTTLVSMYENGAITADHLAAQCIGMIDPDDAGLVLAGLPDAVLDRVLAYARGYQPGRTISTYGIVPTRDQVAAARRWVEVRQAARGSGDASAEPDRHEYRAVDPENRATGRVIRPGPPGRAR